MLIVIDYHEDSEDKVLELVNYLNKNLQVAIPIDPLFNFDVAIENAKEDY